MRVIAGSAKGRQLTAPRGLAVRPTTDKVKGAIFSMLDAVAFRRAESAGTPEGSPFPRVLDLYAGTGALGIEALSRGAEHVDFVEASAGARAAIQENLRRTGFTSRARIHALRTANAVSTFRAPYDLILLDPPYDDPAIPTVLEALGNSEILAEDALVILEHARSAAVPQQAGRLHLARTRHHGTTAITLFEVGEPAAQSTAS